MQAIPQTNSAIKLDESLLTRLTALSTLKSRSPQWLVNAAIEDYVTREETYEREKAEDMLRWQNHQQSGHAVPHSSVAEWLSSWGSDNELPCPK
ncbi:MAG: CopG family transcriptional regulator [Methylovulum sp.]|uniref:CopG family ribbon-helix-helix protein n=1 Tax=Methylovulum sp. TaxID=1916980 RepID=UPI0026035ABC|nr:CopG family transcriptional regulator [Methylovulum sp.]MDD2724146.1 CopG family transcriptional regulator [Methylovulum sp.]MDD5123178.1 CopG family transcriptional regulator [Methylovulum sp.]